MTDHEIRALRLLVRSLPSRRDWIFMGTIAAIFLTTLSMIAFIR